MLFEFFGRNENEKPRVSQRQFDLYREAYEEQATIYERLSTRARFYVTIITFFIGAIAFKLESTLVFAGEFGVPSVLYITMAIVLTVALLFAVLGIRIRSYTLSFDPLEAMKNQEAISEDRFFEDRALDFMRAAKDNHATNIQVAGHLKWSVWLIFVAVALQTLVFVWAAGRNFVGESCAPDVQKTIEEVENDDA